MKKGFLLLTAVVFLLGLGSVICFQIGVELAVASLVCFFFIALPLSQKLHFMLHDLRH